MCHQLCVINVIKYFKVLVAIYIVFRNSEYSDKYLKFFKYLLNKSYQ